MTEIGTTPGEIFYRSPTSLVYVADALREADFELVPYLHCQLLHDCAAPEIGTARLAYEFGTMIREDKSAAEDYAKLDLVGKFVKVEIIDTETDTDLTITWYGVVEHEHVEALGSRQDVQTGFQTFYASDLLRLLEKTPIRTSVVEDTRSDATDPLTIGIGLPFNQDPGGIFVRRGNRSDTEYPADDPETEEDDEDRRCYIFSKTPRTINEWDAYEAVRYLLKHHAPVDEAGDQPNEWRLVSGTLAGFLDWYDIAVATNGRTVKAVLDDLINRRRAVGYFARFNPADDGVDIHVFTFVETDISLPGSKTLKANPNQRRINYESALDVEAQTSTNGITRYHKVIGRGAKRTTTFSATVQEANPDGDTGPESAVFINDWTEDDRDEYLAGASGDAGYDALDADSQVRANTLARAREKWRHVFARFKFNRDSDQAVHDFLLDGGQGYNISPVIPEDATQQPDYEYHGEIFDEEERTQLWSYGIRFLRGLPFLDRYDYSDDKIAENEYGAGFTDITQPEFLPPFAFAEIGEDAAEEPIYSMLDKLHLTSPFAENPRRWSAWMQVVDTEPAIQLQAQPQHMLGLSEWTDGAPASTADEHDPETQGGLDWRDVSVTVCAELPEHLEYTVELDAAATDAPESVLLIEVPDARFDWVVPGTVVDIAGGKLVQTTSGGTVRDDRARLQRITKAAAEWYGRKRQTLDLNYKQVRALFGLGWLITETGPETSPTPINTVITSITYELDQPHAPGGNSTPTTTVRTSFAELDVAGYTNQPSIG